MLGLAWSIVYRVLSVLAPGRVLDGLPDEAARRRAWYTRAVRRHLPLITVVFCQALLAGLAMLFFFVTRPDFAKAFEDYPGRFSFQTRLALTSWFLPALVAVALACDLIALAMPKRSARNFFLGVGLVIPAFGLALAVDGIFVPLFQAAPVR